MKLLDGKIAIVTGGNSGIGKKTVEVFLKNGAKVISCARRSDENSKAQKELSQYGEVEFIDADLRKSEDAKKVIDKTIEKYGRIDVLVNNAGIADKHMRITECTEDWYDNVVKSDQYSVYFMCKYALDEMLKRGEGSIVNVSSIGGRGMAGISYSAAKAAVDAMTRNIAIQVGQTKIRCNAIAPGPTPTALNNPEAMKEFDMEFAGLTARHMDFSVEECDVEDQANAILFFASDLSKRVSGQVLYVDNGSTLFS